MLHVQREDYQDGSMSPIKRWFAESTNPDCRGGAPADVIDGMDLLIGVSGARALPAESLARMNQDAMVFAMANPNPEVDPEEAAPVRADHGDRPLGLPEPDQQRPVLPGRLPRRPRRAGALDHGGHEDGGRAGDRSDRRRSSELREDYIIPSVFNSDVAPAVAAAVAEQARASGEALAGQQVGYAAGDTGSFTAVARPDGRVA